MKYSADDGKGNQVVEKVTKPLWINYILRDKH